MSKSILLVMLVVVFFLALAALRLGRSAQSTLAAPTPTHEPIPFGPGWAADYGLDEGKNADGLDDAIGRLLHEKRP